MKKIFVTMCALMISAASFAQMSSGGFKMSSASTYWGIRLGFVSANISGDNYDLGSRVGMTLGAVAGIKCSPSLPIFLESGLYYSSKGAKNKDINVRSDYLEIPVLMKYGIATGVQDLSVLPYIGPTFNFGIAGQTKTPGGKHDTFGSEDNRLKRFDVGIKLGCGVEYQMVYAELGYHWGVTNISNIDEASAHNRAFYMNIGINF